jgi:GNAT superfamily N-acetyltransferase
MWPVLDAGPALQPAAADDFEVLLALRIRALRASLEALGRFEPARARERFAGSFAAQHMHHVVQAGRRVGCVSLRPQPAALRIDHLYIEPEMQGQGLGSWVMDWACSQSDLRQLPLELAALQGSEANDFYLRHGFAEVSRSEFDIEYRRAPARNPLQVVRDLWALIQARQWMAVRLLLHDNMQVQWWATGETLVGADTFIAVQAMYPEGWTVHLLDVRALQDGRVQTFAHVVHPPRHHLAQSTFRVRNGLIVAGNELWATCEAPPAWRVSQHFPGIHPMAHWPAA